MKSLITLLLFAFFTVPLFSQAPALIPYQAIARDGAGQPLASSTLNARFTLHDITATGTVVWQELQTVSTSALGLFTAQLGSSVSLANVNWAAGAKFMQVELDLGNGFVDIGTQQLMSVPYALYSGEAQNAQNAGNGISSISLTGDTLYLSNGTYVIVPGISSANNSGGGTSTGSALHSCGAANVHNPDLTYGSMTDQEGNIYKTIVIGTQEWMAENLNTSIYRNGDSIPTGLSDYEWENTFYTQQGAWAYYNNDTSYACPYGKMYNWYACVDPRGLCPTDWHVPSDAEWSTMINYLDPNAGGGNNYPNVAGIAMKSAGTIEGGDGYWYADDPSVEGTNSSGFSGLPGGDRFGNGGYYYLGYYGYWWSSSQVVSNTAWYRLLYYNTTDVYRSNAANAPNGWGVRCLRD